MNASRNEFRCSLFTLHLPQNLPVPAQTHFKMKCITMNSGSRCGLTHTTEPECLSVTPAELISAHMKENMSHDQCPSGGGKNKQSCFHSLPLTNIPLRASASCHSAPWSALWQPVGQQWKMSRAVGKLPSQCSPRTQTQVGIWGICKAVCYFCTVRGRGQT